MEDLRSNMFLILSLYQTIIIVVSIYLQTIFVTNKVAENTRSKIDDMS